MKNYIVSSNRMFQDFLQKDRLKNGRSELYAGDVSIKTVTYTDGYSLDIYRPKNAPDNEPLPVIVDIHGGGYIACSKETNIMQSRWFAKNGYSEEFGARPIARLIDEKIKDKFVDSVLFGNLKNGGKAKITIKKVAFVN